MIQDNLYATDCIRTFSGLYMNVFEPTPEMICIEDIAHALSMQCRFAGHTKKFYSVASHALNCSWLVKEPNALSALLHDASEAYLLDIPSPIKKRLPDYNRLEDNLMMAIAQKLGFEYPMNEDVKTVDRKMLEIEWQEVVLNDHVASPNYSMVEETFLNRYYALTKEVTSA